MIRNLLRNFQRILVIQQQQTIIHHPRLHAGFLQRALFHNETNTTAEPPPNTQTSVDKISLTENATTNPTLESDYIKPYPKEEEKIVTSRSLVEALRTRFHLTPDDVKSIMNDETLSRSIRERHALRTLELLCSIGLDKQIFLANPWLLTLDRDRMQIKINLIQSLALRHFNDFVPFLRLSVSRLRKLITSLKREEQSIPHGNRLYYISEKLQLEPSLVAKYLSKRLFILEMPFEMLEQNLEHMINYNISPINIVKDLWAFRYTPKSVALRLERAKRAKKEKIMPWMVRCPEPILQRSLKLSLDELEVLGDKSCVAEYVAERLQYSVEEAKAIMAKHPQVKRVRVTKIKEVLDYLLDEEGYAPFEIAQVPRILCHGLETTKQRLEELKSIGCRPSTLVIVCRSKREYEKFVKSWNSTARQNPNDAKEKEQQQQT